MLGIQHILVYHTTLNKVITYKIKSLAYLLAKLGNKLNHCTKSRMKEYDLNS